MISYLTIWYPTKDTRLLYRKLICLNLAYQNLAYNYVENIEMWSTEPTLLTSKQTLSCPPQKKRVKTGTVVKWNGEFPCPPKRNLSRESWDWVLSGENYQECINKNKFEFQMAELFIILLRTDTTIHAPLLVVFVSPYYATLSKFRCHWCIRKFFTDSSSDPENLLTQGWGLNPSVRAEGWTQV